MKKEKIISNGISAILMLCIFIGVIVFCLAFADAYNDQQIKCENMLGKKVVLENDTLDIVNYNVIHDDLILSNGLKINYEYANKHLIK
jgi:hypothetical protein